MKKFLALLISVMMLFSCVAMAEETAESALTEAEVEAVENQQVLDFDIVMDKLPEGITMAKETVDHVVYCTFSPEDLEDDSVVYIVSVGYAEEFAGQTLTSALTGEQMLQALESLSEGYNMPEVKLAETEHGTAVFSIKEQEADSAYAELVTVYEGYIINMFYFGAELTEENDAIAMQILSDMWIAK